MVKHKTTNCLTLTPHGICFHSWFQEVSQAEPAEPESAEPAPAEPPEPAEPAPSEGHVLCSWEDKIGAM